MVDEEDEEDGNESRLDWLLEMAEEFTVCLFIAVVVGMAGFDGIVAGLVATFSKGTLDDDGLI